MPHNHAPASPGHGHGHAGHGHAAPPAGGAFSAAFALGIGLNLAFVVAETVGGLAANSSALLADAGHNLSDVLSLALAWGAAWLAARRATPTRYTYGYKGATIQAALLNAALLYAALGFLLWETIDHLRHPAPVNGRAVMLLAGLGVLINGFTAWLFRRGHHDVNLRGAYLHMLTDALVSGGVVLGGGLVLLTGWTWLDPVLGLGILALIAGSSWGLLRDTVRLGLHAVPNGIDLAAVQAFLLRQPNVLSVHDLHIWSLSSGAHDTALTAHLVRPGGADAAWLARLAQALATEFHIHHATVQVEDGPTPGGCTSGCADAPGPAGLAAPR